MTTAVADRTTLIEQLEGANPKEFKRPAVPIVYDEYEHFMETGEYPYLDRVIGVIAEKYGIANEGQHSALGHEVYLASGQHRVKVMENTEATLAADGFLPITDLDPTTVTRVALPDGLTYRLVKGQANPSWISHTRVEWVLLPPRKRNNGLSLRHLRQQHLSYMVATLVRQTEMNDPVVRMFKGIA